MPEFPGLRTIGDFHHKPQLNLKKIDTWEESHSHAGRSQLKRKGGGVGQGGGGWGGRLTNASEGNDRMCVQGVAV